MCAGVQLVQGWRAPQGHPVGGTTNKAQQLKVSFHKQCVCNIKAEQDDALGINLGIPAPWELHQAWADPPTLLATPSTVRGDVLEPRAKHGGSSKVPEAHLKSRRRGRQRARSQEGRERSGATPPRRDASRSKPKMRVPGQQIPLPPALARTRTHLPAPQPAPHQLRDPHQNPHPMDIADPTGCYDPMAGLACAARMAFANAVEGATNPRPVSS